MTESNGQQIASSTVLTMADLAALPARLDDQTLALVEAVAKAPLPALAACEPEHFGKCIRAMSILPRPQGDDVRGELMVSLYRRQLGGYPNEALSYLASEATKTCKWFPTIAECLAILARWKRPGDPEAVRNGARVKAAAEYHARLNDARIAILTGSMDDEGVKALPERWQRILDCENLIRLHTDGTVTIPALTEDERTFLLRRFAV